MFLSTHKVTYCGIGQHVNLAIQQRNTFPFLCAQFISYWNETIFLLLNMKIGVNLVNDRTAPPCLPNVRSVAQS